MRWKKEKKLKQTWTTPPGLIPIKAQIPRKAESFSSLSRMFRSEVHLNGKMKYEKA